MLFLKFLYSCTLLLAVSSWLFGHDQTSSEFPDEYGVDVSFPIHYHINPKRYSYQHERYRKLMSGCYKKYSTAECDSYERDRLEMNRNQPPTQHNYTELGFKHIRLPEALWIAIKEYYDKMKTKESIESWPRGNTYVNHWESPTYMVHLDMMGVGLRGGKSLREQIFEHAKPILEEWTGHPLEPTSLYGIRVYKNGAVLSPRKFVIRVTLSY